MSESLLCGRWDVSVLDRYAYALVKVPDWIRLPFPLFVFTKSEMKALSISTECACLEHWEHYYVHSAHDSARTLAIRLPLREAKNPVAAVAAVAAVSPPGSTIVVDTNPEAKPTPTPAVSPVVGPVVVLGGGSGSVVPMLADDTLPRSAFTTVALADTLKTISLM